MAQDIGDKDATMTERSSGMTWMAGEAHHKEPTSVGKPALLSAPQARHWSTFDPLGPRLMHLDLRDHVRRLSTSIVNWAKAFKFDMGHDDLEISMGRIRGPITHEGGQLADIMYMGIIADQWDEYNC